MTACPYSDCQDERAHPRPHLIEAAAIEKRLAAAVAEERKRIVEAVRDFFAEPDTEIYRDEYERLLALIDPESPR